MSFRLEVEGATLVVGAGGHLMSAVSTGVASAGSYVICADSSLANAKKTSNRILELGYRTEAIEMDVKSTDSIQVCFENLKSRGVFVRNLVNGAGINAPTPFFDIRRPEWDEILNVQLIGVAETCRIFGTEMVDRGDGNIINISSASSNPPLSKAFVYSSAKAAVLNLTKNLAREWGTSGVRVNAIRPGFFPTAWNLENFIDDERRDSILKHTPMKRFGIPEELVSGFVWLLSSGSSFTTGSEIAIDGGFSAMSI
jgi:NAD(P)-dependent dehydrogenase (short-subunit alcohol dehydrogenase family)